MRPARSGMRSNNSVYFVTTQTKNRQCCFRSERWARLMMDVIDHYRETGYTLHAYVVMPDHLHILLSPFESVEKSVQLIKGGFSFRAKRELKWNGEIWQQGFTDHRIRNEEDWEHHVRYIKMNPVKAKLAEGTVLYPWMALPSVNFPQGLKPLSLNDLYVRAEARTLQPRERAVACADGAAEPAPYRSKNKPLLIREMSAVAPFEGGRNIASPSNADAILPFESNDKNVKK